MCGDGRRNWAARSASFRRQPALSPGGDQAPAGNRAARVAAVASAVYALARLRIAARFRGLGLEPAERPPRRALRVRGGDTASLTPMRRASSRITWVTECARPARCGRCRPRCCSQESKLALAQLQPLWRLVKPQPDRNRIVVVRDPWSLVRHRHTVDTNACSLQMEDAHSTRRNVGR